MWESEARSRDARVGYPGHCRSTRWRRVVGCRRHVTGKLRTASERRIGEMKKKKRIAIRHEDLDLEFGVYERSELGLSIRFDNFINGTEFDFDENLIESAKQDIFLAG